MPLDVNWLTLWKDFDKFKNQLRYQLKHTNQQSSTFRSDLQQHCSSNDAQVPESNTNMQEQFVPPPPPPLPPPPLLPPPPPP